MSLSKSLGNCANLATIIGSISAISGISAFYIFKKIFFLGLPDTKELTPTSNDNFLYANTHDTSNGREANLLFQTNNSLWISVRLSYQKTTINDHTDSMCMGGESADFAT